MAGDDEECVVDADIKEAWERTRAFVFNGDPTVKQFGVGMGDAASAAPEAERTLIST